MSGQSQVNDRVAARPGIWIGDLNPRELKTFFACFGGWTLDAFDANLFSLVIPALIATMHLSRPQAGVLATIGLMASAVGGWMAGALADRYGRVKVLQLTILWFAVFAFATGFAQNLQQLAVCRILQGIGFGGEWATGAVLMAEVIRPRFRGRAVGTVQSGWAVGWGMAVLTFAAVFSLWPQAQAWRVLFWIGLVPSCFVFYVRRFVEEPEAATQRRPLRGSLGRIFVVFSPSVLRRTLPAVLLTTGAQGSFYAVNIWLPTFLKTERKLTVLGSSGYLAFVILGALCGFLSAAWLADRIGRKRTFLLFGVAAGAVVCVYMLAPLSNQSMLFLGFPLGYFANGIFAPMGAFLSELFPTEIRATAQGFAYNAGRAIGSLFPTLIGFLAASMTLGLAISVFTATAYGCVVIALTLLPETAGTDIVTDWEPNPRRRLFRSSDLSPASREPDASSRR